MGQQQITGQLQGGGIGITGLNEALSVFDGISAPTVSAWTLGGSVWNSIQVQIPLGEVWSIVAWSITFVGVCINPGASPFGKCGRVEAALMSSSINVPPQTTPMRPFPPDAISRAVLWDGITDPMFPFVPASGPATLIPLHSDVLLPVPQSIPSGSALSIGVNITPSLLKVVGALGIAMICLVGVKWAVTFDDGKPQQSGWGG